MNKNTTGIIIPTGDRAKWCKPWKTQVSHAQAPSCSVLTVHLVCMQQFPFADPLLRLLNTLRHCEDVLQVLHGRHVLWVSHVLITDILQLRIQSWHSRKWFFNPLKAEKKHSKKCITVIPETCCLLRCNTAYSSSVEQVQWRSEGMYCLHLQDQRVSPVKN